MNLSRPWARRADFAALSAWLIASLFMALSAFLFFGEDFRDFYSAAHVLRAGGDVYDYRQVAATMQVVAGYSRYNPFYYPPWFAVAMLPFTFLPYQVARAAWLVSNLLFWLCGLWTLSSAMEWPKRPLEGRWRWGGRWLLYLAATYLFAWMTWRYEQLGIVIFALLAGALWAVGTGRFGLGGVLLALMLTKPTVSGVVVVALLVWMARGRHWRALAGFGVTLGVLTLLSLPVLPSWIAHMRDPQFGRGLTYVLDASGGIARIRINTTLKDWLTALQVNAIWIAGLYVVSAVVGGGVLAALLWRGSPAVTVAAYGVVVGFWLAPYALQYDFPMLTVPLFLIIRQLGLRTRRVRFVGGCLLLGVLSVPFWERPISDGFWIVVGVAALLAVCGLTRVRAQDEPPLVAVRLPC